MRFCLRYPNNFDLSTRTRMPLLLRHQVSGPYWIVQDPANLCLDVAGKEGARVGLVGCRHLPNGRLPVMSRLRCQQSEMVHSDSKARQGPGYGSRTGPTLPNQHERI
jgi:hypothetical protein